ncbi:MAG: GatB/YqeY domain-containing protein [Thermoanaerobaculia bacterium]
MSDTPKERIATLVREAMKAGDKERLPTLRLLLNDIQNEALRTGVEVDDATFQTILKRAVKQRREAAAEYRNGQREELAAREEAEAEILGGFLPRQASDDEIRAAIREIVVARELSGMQALGTVMKETLARFAGAAEGGTVNRLAREILAGS